MSEILEYKCPACGGALEFDSASQKMKCPYCDSVYDMSQLVGKDEILDRQQPEKAAEQQSEEFEWQQAGEQWGSDETENISVFVCKSCGGEIVCDTNTVATACPYCGNQVVMSGRVSGMLKPNYVIPFKLDKKAAKAKLKTYVSSKKFAPSAFKSESKLDEIKGIYVPFWLFDSHANACVHFDATKVRHWSDSRYNYTETSYYDVYREGEMRFENIPVDGSKKMPDDLMESLEPFDFNEAVDFQTAYLAGYLADKYDVTMEESIPRANERIQTSAVAALEPTVQGYVTATPKISTMHVIDGQSKYAMYPVWLLNTTYKGEKYQFAMNGQTGKFIGNLPVDKGKLAALFAGLSVGISAVVFLLGIVSGLF